MDYLLPHRLTLHIIDQRRHHDTLQRRLDAVTRELVRQGFRLDKVRPPLPQPPPAATEGADG